MQYLLVISLLICFLASLSLTNGEVVDQHESCEYWASIGECEKNPGYMLENCALSCSKIVVKNEPIPDSIYDITETDIHGNTINFNDYRGKVVYIVNVASQCGYTQSGYALLSSLVRYKQHGLELMIAPCNQFGQQEPGNSKAIQSFAKSKGFEGVILSKADVNGPETRTLFRYLKEKTSKHYIQWNFDGKFVIDRHGDVHTIDSDEEALHVIMPLLEEQVEL